MGKPYVIRVSSQKGGVGKTTIAVNLATALQSAGYKVLLVDSDRTSPAVGEYFGIRNSNNGYTELLQGNVELKGAVLSHQATDLNIVAGTTDTQKIYDPDQKRTVSEMEAFHKQVEKIGYDFVIIDSSPGPILQGTAKFYDEVLIVTTPERISCYGSKRLADQCEKYHIRCRLVVNRFGYSRYDLSIEEIQKLYGDIIGAVVPEDGIVIESVAKQRPAKFLDSQSYFVKAISDLSRVYALRAGVGSIHGLRKEDSSKTFLKSVGRLIGMH